MSPNLPVHLGVDASFQRGESSRDTHSSTTAAVNTVSLEAQPLLPRHLLSNGGPHAHVDPVSLLASTSRMRAGTAPNSGAPSSSMGIESSEDDERPPTPQEDPAAWKYLVAMCTLSVVICYAGEL